MAMLTAARPDTWLGRHSLSRCSAEAILRLFKSAGFNPLKQKRVPAVPASLGCPLRHRHISKPLSPNLH
jgi:hypothetical protein